MRLVAHDLEARPLVTRAQGRIVVACERILPKPGEFYDAELAFSWLLPDLLADAPAKVLAARRELFLGNTRDAAA
jgi:hypothetical protein